MIMRSTCPFSVSSARPPRPSAPALLDTAVSEWRDSGPRFRSAAIKVASPCQSFQAFHTTFLSLEPLDLHAIPHSPNPELSSTEPLLMSATASSALFHTFEPPRPTAGTAANLRPVECEKVLLPGQRVTNPTPDAALDTLTTTTPPTATNCREHARRTTNPGSGAVCLTTRATPAILPIVGKKLACKQTQHSNVSVVSIVASPRSQKKKASKSRPLQCIS
jgi:hypothetical protein